MKYLHNRWGNIVIIWIIVIVFTVWLAFIVIESANKKLKLARKYHKIGERLYKKGDTESSKLYYEAANIYRERAYKRLEE